LDKGGEKKKQAAQAKGETLGTELEAASVPGPLGERATVSVGWALGRWGNAPNEAATTRAALARSKNQGGNGRNG
jgi:hypothetical protein